jgi:hypothetical protein
MRGTFRAGVIWSNDRTSYDRSLPLHMQSLSRRRFRIAMDWRFLPVLVLILPALEN